MSNKPRVARDDQDLIESLKQHLKLLSEFSDRAFANGETAYYGEVAGKLRLLVYRGGRNTPLLLALMKKFNVQIQIPFDRPGGVRLMTLDDYLDNVGCAIDTPSRGLVALSRKQFVATWAQQLGASHQDWQIDEEFAAAISTGTYVFGQPAHVRLLRAISNTVLWVGNEFLERIDSSGQVK